MNIEKLTTYTWRLDLGNGSTVYYDPQLKTFHVFEMHRFTFEQMNMIYMFVQAVWEDVNASTTSSDE